MYHAFLVLWGRDRMSNRMKRGVKAATGKSMDGWTLPAIPHRQFPKHSKHSKPLQDTNYDTQRSHNRTIAQWPPTWLGFMGRKKTRSIVPFILKSDRVATEIVAVDCITNPPLVRRCSYNICTATPNGWPNCIRQRRRVKTVGIMEWP